MKHRSKCPIARSLDVLGDKWTLVILRDALVFGHRTYSEFASGDEGIPTNLLASRLKRLVDQGFMERRPYQQHPLRYEYLPTARAQAVRPVLKALKQFAERELDDPVVR